MRCSKIKSISFDACEEFISDSSFETNNDNKNKRENAKKILIQIITKQLSERQKQIALLYFFEKKNMPEIAELLGINKSTVSRTLARALKNINDKIQYYKLR